MTSASLSAQLSQLERENAAMTAQVAALIDKLHLDWAQCAACGAFKDRKQSCPVCHPPAPAAPSSWPCPACTTPNPVSAKECAECGCDQPAAPASALPVPSPSLRCPACFTLNPAGSRECVECESVLAPAAPADTIDLSVDGKRESLTETRATELFSALPKSQATFLRLSTKSFGKQAAQVARDFIKGHAATLTAADFSDIIAGRPTMEALEVLEVVCGALLAAPLRKLDLSDNALGESGMRVLQPVLSQLGPGLQELQFKNNGLSELAMRLLVGFLQQTPQLEALHFESNMSGDGGAEAVSALLERGTLKAFSMASCRVRQRGGLALARALPSAPNLVRLDLSDSMFGGEAGLALARALGQLKHLEALVLRDTGIEGAPAVEALIAALHSQTKLELLDLSSVELGHRHAAKLAAGLAAGTPRLRELKLAECELGDKGALALADAPPPPALQLLDVRGNELTGKSAITLAQNWGKGLKMLMLEDNEIKPDAADEVKRIVGAERVVLGEAEE